MRKLIRLFIEFAGRTTGGISFREMAVSEIGNYTKKKNEYDGLLHTTKLTKQLINK
jgi:hypothetical protein